jgi:hypothetical protein
MHTTDMRKGTGIHPRRRIDRTYTSFGYANGKQQESLQNLLSLPISRATRAIYVQNMRQQGICQERRKGRGG